MLNIKHSKTLISGLVAALAISFSSSVFSQDQAPVTVDGLVLLPDSKVDVAYLKPDADFSDYTKFMIEVAEVHFKKGWERDMKRGSSRLRISSSDKERIIKDLSDLLYDSFSEELQKNDDFLVVNQPGDDVLALRVSVIDLYITAPDLRNTSGLSTTYVANAGSMVLVGELIDSSSGEVLARFADGKAARDNISMQWSSSVSNRQEGLRMFRNWAKILKEGIEEVQHLND